MPSSRHGTLSRSSTTPRSPLAPISTAEQQLSRERIADLHGRPFAFRIFVEFRRRHAGAVDAVAPGLRAQIHDRHADAGGGRVENLVLLRDADRPGVDE